MHVKPYHLMVYIEDHIETHIETHINHMNRSNIDMEASRKLTTSLEKPFAQLSSLVRYIAKVKKRSNFILFAKLNIVVDEHRTL